MQKESSFIGMLEKECKTRILAVREKILECYKQIINKAQLF